MSNKKYDPTDPILKESRRLYSMGFGIHWLLPESKRPVETKWTTGGRKSWEALLMSYEEGMNVGVRLGRASKVDGVYLAVIDCDVKSVDPHHRGEMEDRLKELFEFRNDTPKVVTGRGGGSCHIYVTTAEPVAPKRLAQSKDLVKVMMPSVKPSRREMGELNDKEREAGWRLRAAWEISVMGEGQQVVLPPSIHPDTQREYQWKMPLAEVSQIPSVGLAASVPSDHLWKGEKEAAAAGKRALLTKAVPQNVHRPELARNGDFHAIPVDLVSSDLANDIVDMINLGTGCDDRSAGLFKASIAMVRGGFTDDQILSVLTDPDTYLGAASFDHAQTKSRGRAAQWLYKYTLVKARREFDARNDFEAVVRVDKDDDGKGGDGGAADGAGGEQIHLGDHEDLGWEQDWRDQVERGSIQNGYRPKNTLKNCLTILRGEFGSELFQLNEFSGLETHTRDTPWGAKAGDEITDTHVVLIKDWFARMWRYEPGNDRIQESITVISKNNSFHPVRDYLEELEWDGVSRLNYWLKDYCNAMGDDAYIEAISRKVLCAMVARIYKPGTKFDHVLILEGKQGRRKSTVVRVLASEAWFSDATINVADKDAVLAMRAAWVMELGELSGMRKADVDVLKEFISRTVDRIRLPYGRRTEAFPRQGIFIGTTNAGEYLKDTTGNRRFWPVNVGECDTEGLTDVRDQLFAEAKVALDFGEKLYLDDMAVAAAAMGEQAHRTMVDIWVERLEVFLRSTAESVVNRALFTLAELFDHGPLADTRPDRIAQMRASEALRALGYIKKKMRGPDKIPRWYYFREDQGVLA